MGNFLNRVFNFFALLEVLFAGVVTAHCEIQSDELCEKNSYFQIGGSYKRANLKIPLTYDIPDDCYYWEVLKPFYKHWEDGRSTAKTFSSHDSGCLKMRTISRVSNSILLFTSRI